MVFSGGDERVGFSGLGGLLGNPLCERNRETGGAEWGCHMKTILLVALIYFTVTFAGVAANITSKQDLEGISTVTPGEYTLKPGEHTITHRLDLAGERIIVDTADTVVNIFETSTPLHQVLVAGFTVNAGVVNLNSGNNSRAVHVSGDFTQNGGTVNAIGNPGGGNALMGQSQFDYYLGGGILNATAGNGSYATSISQIANFTVKGGKVTASGGGGQEAFGIQAPEQTLISGGTAEFFGGAGYMALGLFDTKLMKVSGATQVTAKGGSGLLAYGVSGKEFVLSEGTVAATGGSGQQSFGMQFNSLSQTGGDIVAEGGTTAVAHGLRAGNARLSGGTLTAKGGAGNNVYGFSSDTILQTGGVLTGEGGSSADYSLGIYCRDNFEQQAGLFRAVGGEATGSYGAYLAASGVELSGTVEMERRGESASLFSVEGLTLKRGATLSPVISHVGGNFIAGLLVTNPGETVAIDAGVTLAPLLANASLLREEDGNVELLFIDTGGGAITGEFDSLADTLTLGLSADKRGDKYYLTVWRKADIQTLLPRDLPHRNGNSVINGIGSYFASGNSCDPLQRVWDHLESCSSVEELHARARRVGSTLAPEAYADMPKVYIQMLDMIDTNFLRQIRPDATGGGAVAAASTLAMASASPRDASTGRWRIWANPMFHHSMRNRAKTAEFENSKDTFWGASLGASRQLDRIVVGMEGHFLKGSYDSQYSRIDSDNYGFRLGARIGGLFSTSDSFNPWAALSLGYDHSRMEQRNVDFFGAKRRSKPTAHMVSVKTETGCDISLGDRLTLTPIVGLEYIHIRQGGYTDHGASDYLLHVSGNGYNSLRTRAGLRAEARAGERTIFSLWGNYRFETLDTHASFNSAFVSFPEVRFVARGEDRSRSSGNFGAGLSHDFGRARLSADYDLTVESRYLAHRVGLRIAVDF